MGDIRIIPRKPKEAPVEAVAASVKKVALREPDWTEKRLMSVIRASLRSLWSRLPVRLRVLDRVKEGDMFKCEECRQLFKALEVDHIESCGSLLSFEDLPEFCRKMFLVTDEGCNALCKSCHGKKTREDNRLKRENLL